MSLPWQAREARPDRALFTSGAVPAEPDDVLSATVGIVCGLLSRQRLPADAVADLIVEVHVALVETVAPGAGREGQKPRPAVRPDRSVTPDYLICLEDGKPFKALKRHLRAKFDLSPEEYRRKWGLPPDYPMIAPNFARERSDIAKRLGLGQKAKDAWARRRIERAKSGDGDTGERVGDLGRSG